VTRLLGVDLGERRIGLAIGDTETGGARPLRTIRRSDPDRDSRTLARVCEEQRIDGVVVGLPLNTDDSEGPQAVATRNWVASVADAVPVPITYRDERLTTERAEAIVGAQRRGSGGGPPSGAARNTRRARVDQEAAAEIVQAELDARAAARGRD
jgi:putative pre-16S rRNA nuclease